MRATKTQEVINGRRYCVFCGNELKGYYDDHELYYECDCIDYRETQRIDRVISDLVASYPKAKFEIKGVLNKI